MAIEEAPFTVEKSDGDFELRRYAPQIVAEITVEGAREQAGNRAFYALFNYISGANRSKSKIAMTAPVSQESSGEKIEMTAPVGQQQVSNLWAVSFMMPSGYTMDTLPDPTDQNVRLRAIPARRMAAVRYSGSWSSRRYEKNLSRLVEWMKANNLTATGAPVWARYDPPFTLWFMRRNDILIPVAP